jgi:hypothetical protein
MESNKHIHTNKPNQGSVGNNKNSNFNRTSHNAARQDDDDDYIHLKQTIRTLHNMNISSGKN